MQNVIWILISVIIISLISCVGILLLTLKPKCLQNILIYLISFAIGVLFGTTFLHLLPKVYTANTTTGAIIILGSLALFFFLERIIYWHHCHFLNQCEPIKTVGTMSLIGDTLHNIIDGIAIAGSYLISLPLGIATTIAMILHEIPQEISDFGILLHAKFSVKKALFLNFLAALGSLGGALIVLAAQSIVGNITALLVPLTSASFIYIAGSDLIPELLHRHKEATLIQLIFEIMFMLLGMGFMYIF